MEQVAVEDGHDANGDGIFVQKRSGTVSPPSTVTRTRSSMSTMASSFSTIRSLSFRESPSTIFKYESLLEGSDSDVLENFDTVDDALDAVAIERLRYMPHDGSLLDRIFKWSTHVISHVNELSKAVEPFVPNAVDAARMSWGHCLMLLQIGPDHLPVLVKAFQTFQEITLELARFINQSVLINSIPGVQGEIAGAYMDLIELISSVASSYYRGSRGSLTIEVSEFEARFGHHIESFYTRKAMLTEMMWSTTSILQGTSLKKIKEYLSFSDSTIASMIASRRPTYAEFTCDWFAPHLSQIKHRKNGLSVITGGPGSGKTVLSQWIIDHSQIMTDDEFDVIVYRVYEDISATTSSIAVVKGLLLQMLDRQVGNHQLLQAIDKAIQLSSCSVSALEVEEALWGALRIAVEGTKRLIIVVDGISSLHDESNIGPRVLQQLNSLTPQAPHVRVIALSRPLKTSLPQRTFQFSLESSHIGSDIKTVTLDALSSTKPFSDLKIGDRESIAESMIGKFNGSFLWPHLVLELAKQQRTINDILSIVQAASTSVSELLEQVVAKLSLDDSETRSILAWSLASHRPLLVHEVKALLETDTKRLEHVHRVGAVKEDILHALGSLVTIKDGAVFFKHSVFRHYLLGMAGAVADFSNNGKFPFHLKEAHYDLVIRSLAHTKYHVRDELDVSTTPLSLSMQDRFFSRSDLLEYTARYWVSHFVSSPMADGDEYKLTSTFKQCIPDSIFLALLEGSCLTSQYTLQEAERLQMTAFKIRKSAFGASHPSVLQALIFEAVLSHRLQLHERLDYAYEVWTLSKVVLGYNSLVVKASAELFIQVLESVTKLSETILARKEELLLYLIDIAKEDRGSSHGITIKYSQMLVQLYIDIQKTEKATRLCKELYDISVSQYGQFSSETAAIGTLLFEQLHYLSESEAVKDIIETGHEYTIRTLDITDERRITSTLSIVGIYEKRGDVTKAEAVFFELWQGISRIEEISSDTVEKQIRVALAYSEFLVRHSSRDEAENIVSTLWESIERRQQLEIEQVVSWSQRITAHMRKMQWHSLAQSTLTSVWKRCQTLEESSYSETIAESLIDAVHETTETTETETETTTVVAKRKRISIAREAFESVMSSKKTSKEISVATLKTAETLITSYTEEREWEESIRVSKRLLDQQWKGIEASKQVITLTQGVKQMVTVALNLAVSYFETLQIEKATTIYSNVFHSLLLSVGVDDELVTQTLRAAIAFYEKTYQFSRAIVLYQDYIAAIKSAHGDDHHLVIEISYALADLAIRCHQPEEAEKAYYHIFTVFNHDGDLHQDGIKAAHGLCKLYMEQQRWEAALHAYAVLWDAITTHAKELQLETDYVQEIYQSYTYLLETKLHAEDTVIRDLAYNYRETCIALYGQEHIMAYKATVQLAEVSQRIEQYHEESIAMYEAALRYREEYEEEVVTYESTTTWEKTSKKKSTIKEHLAEMYSKNEKTVTRATELFTEEFKASSSQYGYSSQESLSSLEQLVLTYKKQSTVTEAVETLQTVVINIFESETDTQKLTESARRLATLYLEIGQQDSAVAIFEDLRRRLVYEAKSISRKATVFVVAFEEVITGGSYTTIMADLVAEMHLYDAFFNVARTSKFIDAFITGVRLLIFQRSRGQVEEAQRTDTELYRLFTEYYSLSDGVELHAFYELCIEEVLQGDYEVRIASRTMSTVHKYFQEENFQAAYSVALLFHEFVHAVDGFRSQAIVKQGFKLCKYLQGHGVKRTSDVKLQAVMLSLSKSILTHILRVYRSLGVRFTELDVFESNELAVLLGEQRNFEDLELLLTDLWTSRIVQKTWSSDTIVAIGRRLVEARFSCGKTEQAIRLCSDICYNLRRVWGTFDRVALELTTLLSELYASTNNHRAAMAVHEKVLRQLISESENVSAPEGAVIALKQVELLKRSYQRLGGWDKEEHLYKQLFKALNGRFDGQTAWQSTPPEQLDEWPKEGADELGMWHAPGSYGFLVGGGGEGPEKRPAHQNQLRKVSESRLLTIRSSA